MAPLGPFPESRQVAVAVSGGADSMALALLLRTWGRPLALVVDHGLRPESAQEARVTMERLAAAGIPARMLQASIARGPALAARARAARYRLLLDACRDVGCCDLLLAHHAGDQAETVLLRAASGSGPAGQAGMAAVAYLDAARLLRPLLHILPCRLRATLRAARVAWIEDPSNADPATPRARLRAGPLSDAAAIRAELDRAALHGAWRTESELASAAELAGAATIHPEGYAVLTAAVPAPALSALIWTLSGAAHPPPAAGVARLAQNMQPGTLYGVRVAAAGRQGAGWVLGREAAAAAAPVPASTLWDGRFRLDGAAPPETTLGALGGDAARFRRLSPLPAFVLQSLPTLRNDGAVLAVPHLQYPDAATCRSVPILFCPSRPAAPAPFVVA